MTWRVRLYSRLSWLVGMFGLDPWKRKQRMSCTGYDKNRHPLNKKVIK